MAEIHLPDILCESRENRIRGDSEILAAVHDNSRYKGFDLFDTVLKGHSSLVLAMIKTFH